jgi:CMP-N-acetylneuraminic acid synthetase
MIAWTIEAASGSGLFADVLVSTEDEEIAEAARFSGARLLDRPAELAGDRAGVVDVCLDVLDREAAAGQNYDHMCCLYATAPLRNADDIRATAAPVLGGEASFALAACRYEQPPHQALKLNPDGVALPFLPDLVNRRADEIGDLVVDNGSTYVVDVAAFRRAHSFYGLPLRVHIMPRARAIDLDDMNDLALLNFYAESAIK